MGVYLVRERLAGVAPLPLAPASPAREHMGGKLETMGIGRFYGGIGALIRAPESGKYLLLKRSEGKDFASGVWECVTGRVDQGEGFEDAVHREVWEELGAQVHIDFVVGTTHFYRGDPNPENELIGVVYACSLDDPDDINISAEHSEHRWLSASDARELLDAPDPSTKWMLRVLERAEQIRRLSSPELLHYFRDTGFELG
jgi:8-oxo-dGTP diphosphatase